MAWGTLKEVGWVNAFTSGKYATDNYVKYQIDESSRKLRVIVTRQRVRSLDSYHSYDGPTNNGCQFVNGDKDSSYPKGYDTNDSIKVSGNGTVNIPSNKDRKIGAVYTYNDDGSVPSVVLSTQMIFTLNESDPSYDPTYYDFSVQNWKSQDLKSQFPTIAKKINPVTDLKVTKVTNNSISVSFTASEGAVKYNIQAIVMEDTTDVTGLETTDTKGTFTTLVPGTTYLISVRAIDSNGNYSDRTNVANITTLSQAVVLINVDGIAKKGLGYINVNGVAKKVITIYVNVNGVAREYIPLEY